MATRRNDFLLGLQAASQVLGPLSQAMGQWRDDRIANELLQTASAPRAQAVDPTLQPAADARAAAMPIPIPQGSGAKGLQMRMQLDKAMQDRQLKSAQLQNVQARTAAVGKPKSYKPDDPSIIAKRNREPYMESYKRELSAYHAERSKLNSSVGMLQDGLAAKAKTATGLDLEQLLPLKGAYRANVTGATDEKAGKYARLRGANDQLVTMPWDEYQSLLKGHATLQQMQKRLAGMTPPELPVFEPGAEASEQSSVTSKQSGTGKKLDQATAMRFLKEAGGDKEKARQLARAAGYQF